MVQHIEEIGAEIQTMAFAKPEMLGHGQVPVLLERPAEGIARSVAEKSGIAGETCRIQVTVHPVLDVARGVCTGRRAANKEPSASCSTQTKERTAAWISHR